MKDTTATIEILIQHHLEAFSQNNIRDLLQDYSEEAEVWTPDGLLSGPEAISNFYTQIFAILPAEATSLSVKQTIISGNKAYLVWSAESPFVQISLGTDSFEIKNGKIIWQTLAAHIIEKQ